MKRLILLFTLLPILSIAQQTYVPDDNFEQALIFLGYDNVLDNYVTTANISGVTYLELSMFVVAQNISDLSGIEDFIALESFACQGTQLTSLDLSNNTALTNINCSDNQLACLNLKNGNNINLTILAATNNPNLICIEVDDPSWSTANWSPWIDPQTSFSTNCNYPLGCFSIPTNIKEHTNNISLYPNPTSDLISLDIKGYNGTIEAEVYDLSGRLLNSTNSTTISLKDYAKGIYVFRVAYGEITEELKVIKD